MWTYRSRTFLLEPSLMSPLGTGVQSDSASALTLGASDSISCVFAFVRWGTCEYRTAHAGGGPYLAVFKNKAETSGNRFERTEGICGISHPTQEQFGRSRRSRSPVRFSLIRSSARFAALVVKSCGYMTRSGGGARVICGVFRESS